MAAARVYGIICGSRLCAALTRLVMLVFNVELYVFFGVGLLHDMDPCSSLVGQCCHSAVVVRALRLFCK